MTRLNKKEMRGIIGQTAAAKREFSEEEKMTCSIDAMKNGGTCEACL